MRRALVLVLLCISTDALAQTPGATVITGRVVAVGTDVPLRRARVDLPARNTTPALPPLYLPASSESVFTDDDGRFSIEVRGAAGASIPLTISKGGYATVVAVVRRESVSVPLDIRLARGAAITGVVLDVKGAPVQGYAVTVRRVDGNPERDGAPSQYSGVSDDRGEYRVGGLVRGTYDVTAGRQSQLMELVNGKVQIRESGLGAVVQVRVDVGDEIGGVQLVAPAMTPVQEAAAKVAEANRLRGLADPRDVPLPRGAAAIVRGRVLTAARTPLPDVVVRVNGPTTNLLRTDQDGRFEARGLRAGQYTVEALPNEIVWRYGQERVGQSGRPIAVPTDQTVDGVDIVLPAARAIQGVVTDEHGEPAQGARVQAYQVEFIGDRLVPTPVGTPYRTDDRGNYRLWGVYDGAYLISAAMDGTVSGQPPRRSSYATIYYPGSPTVAGAQRIDLRQDTIANLSFIRVTLSEVTGVALDGEAPLVTGRVQLIEARQQGLVSSARGGTIQPDGTFAIRHVPPGNYVLQVLGDGPGRTGLFAAQALAVGETPVHVTMKASHGTSVEGRLVLEGEPSSFQVIPVALDERARTESRMAVIGSSEFFITGLFGPTAFSLRRGFADDWYLKSFTINGVDVSDTGFDFGARPDTISDAQLVLSRNGASISGRLRNSAVNNYFVVAFSTSRDQRFAYSRRVKFARAGADGSFRIGGLPPGNYFVAAVDHLEGTIEGGEWQNPELLLRLESGAERVALLEGQAETVSLRLNQR